MKIIYSEIKKLLPGLKKPARKLADDLTMIGHFCDGFEKIDGQEVISLEVRQNRGDCLGYYGIAKEIATLYNLQVKTEKIDLHPEKEEKIKIDVAAKKETKRIMAATITGVENKSSPDWLKTFLKLHEINPINTIVDLTNYIMLWYGIPNHAFDTKKIGSKLVWELNQGKHQLFTSLDGSKIELKKGSFQVTSQMGVACLAGLVGGKNSAIGSDTKETLVEMAIYDRTKVRQDSRGLRVVTEASTRLEKDLDPELIPQAFSHLIRLIIDNCGGKVSSKIYDYYPEKEVKKPIAFDWQKPSLYSGIEIKKEHGQKILDNLGCKISPKGITPPSYRKDINIEEDLVEEVIRFYGYQKIPNSQPIVTKKLKDITPKVVYIIENSRNILTDLGYDEIRSWPLVKQSEAKSWSKKQPIITQNSINSDYTTLRTSIISSLLKQKRQYQKYKLANARFFEIGKIYYKQKDRFRERYCLGIYDDNQNRLKNALKSLEDHFKIDLPQKITQGNFLEIDLEKIEPKKLDRNPKMRKTTAGSIVELTRQIIILDANLITNQKKDPKTLLKKYLKIIGGNLWQIKITDIYFDQKKKKYKYTFQVSYFNINDKEAKKLHLKSFGLS